jgi:hypothetical protein
MPWEEKDALFPLYLSQVRDSVGQKKSLPA